MKTRLTDLLNIEYPIIMAPMFLVSNTKMIIEALNNGITAAIPAMNYKTDKELRAAITEIRKASDKPFGFNLIVNKSNPRYKQQLKTLIELNIDYIITSLGNPKEVIAKCKPLGIKVFCDVVDLKTAQKVEGLGADAIIAVNRQAGGHAGPYPAERLIPQLKENCTIPIISAGGVATHEQLNKILALGADGVSVGTPFIASKECSVSDEYKQAIVEFKGKDIVLTNKISGTHLAVINTPYVQEIGTKATFLENLLNKNRFLKKYIKMLIFNNGMKAIEKSAFKATYKTVWVAGPSIEDIHEIKTVKEIIKQLTI
ncbi:MAG: nitronate monooxygenase [Salinivirgaceae bacterium]|nr:nitronate monooxygenase [Salinivirgaceae bacterium]